MLLARYMSKAQSQRERIPAAGAQDQEFDCQESREAFDIVDEASIGWRSDSSLTGEVRSFRGKGVEEVICSRPKRCVVRHCRSRPASFACPVRRNTSSIPVKMVSVTGVTLG